MRLSIFIPHLDNVQNQQYDSLPYFYINASFDYVAWLGLGNKTLAIKFLFVSGSDRVPLSTLNRVDLTLRRSQEANTFTVL